VSQPGFTFTPGPSAIPMGYLPYSLVSFLEALSGILQKEFGPMRTRG